MTTKRTRWKVGICLSIYTLMLAYLVFLLDEFNSGRTIETAKWDLLVDDKVAESCLTFDELNMKVEELESRDPTPKYKARGLAGVRSWMCENGWRN